MDKCESRIKKLLTPVLFVVVPWILLGCELDSGSTSTTNPISLTTGTTSTQVSTGTVDNFVYAFGESASAGVSVVDPSGNVYIAGSAVDVNGMQHWIVREGTDSSWTTVDDIADSGDGSLAGAFPVAIASDSKGNIYVAGQALDTNGYHYWIVREGSGTNWLTTDSLDDDGDASEAGAWPSAIAIDSSNNVFVVGTALDTNGYQHWVLRGSAAASPFPWLTLDDIDDSGDSSAAGAFAQSVAVDSLGNVYVSGIAEDSGSDTYWFLREGNFSNSWTTVDKVAKASFSFLQAGNLPTPGNPIASGETSLIKTDSSDTVYVIEPIYRSLGGGGGGGSGFGTESGGIFTPNLSARYGWIVRSGNGTHWVAVDLIQDDGDSSASNASPYAMTIDSSNNVWVAGTAIDTNGVQHSIVRKGKYFTWETKDDIDDDGDSSYAGATPYAIAVDSSENVYVATQAFDANSYGHWVLLKGVSGTTWSKIDDIVDDGDSSNAGAFPSTIAISGSHVYTSGAASDVDSDEYWFVREN